MNEHLMIDGTSKMSNGKVRVNYRANLAGEFDIQGFFAVDGEEWMDMTPKMLTKYLANKLVEYGNKEIEYWG